LKLQLKDLKPNPFRDFKIDPVDNSHVGELAKSVRKNGFWGGVEVRRGENGYEVPAGWHRILAARKAGEAEIDLPVRSLSDEQMRSRYAWENATQRGNTSTALAGTIATAVRTILYKTLSPEESPSETRGGHNRDGVGRDAILAELADIPGITETVVRAQLANLKASGDYDRIVNEVVTIVETEHRARLTALRKAEEERAAAERREAEAKGKREAIEEAKRKAAEEKAARDAEAKAAREAATKARDEAERKRKTAEAERKAKEAKAAEEKRKAIEEQRRKAAEAEEKAKAERKYAQAKEESFSDAKAKREAIDKARATKHEVTFDLAGVAKHIKNPSQVETFRRLAEKHADFLPVAGQAPLAKTLVEAANDRDPPHKGQLSAEFIEKEFLGLLSMAKATKRDMMSAAKAEELKRRSWEDKVGAATEMFRVSANGVQRAVGDLAYLEENRPQTASRSIRTEQFDKSVKKLREALAKIDGDLKETVLEIEDRHGGWGKPV